MGVLIAGLVIGAIFGAVIVSGIAVTMLQPLPFDKKRKIDWREVFMGVEEK